jgi:hypothetical protein
VRLLTFLENFPQRNLARRGNLWVKEDARLAK